MKKTMSRSIISLILALLFLGGLGLLCFRYAVNNSEWANQTYNQYLYSRSGFTDAGTIYDRNGVILAESRDDKRFYHEDESTRMAMLHTVGDTAYNIEAAVQSHYSAKLNGHSGIFGYGLPDKLKPKGDVEVTLDSSVCKQVYEAFEGKKGACLVYNYKTGEVICMVSTPSYDIANEPEVIPDGAYLNNVISSTYTPGSIFKMVTTVAALENIPDIEERVFYCEGKKEFDGDDVTCLDSHGEMTLEEAFARSCNIAFAELSTELGRDVMQKTAESLGITRSFSFDSVSTAKGHFELQDANFNELAWAGVGQYTNMVNPAQMAILCGAVANGGEAALPYFVKGEKTELSGELLDSETAEKLQKIMRYTISDYYGDDMFYPLEVGAKTGTAETTADKESTAWIVGYSRNEECPLAFAVVVEEGGFGYYSAGPIAKIAMVESAKSLGFEG